MCERLVRDHLTWRFYSFQDEQQKFKSAVESNEMIQILDDCIGDLEAGNAVPEKKYSRLYSMCSFYLFRYFIFFVLFKVLVFFMALSIAKGSPTFLSLLQYSFT